MVSCGNSKQFVESNLILFNVWYKYSMLSMYCWKICLSESAFKRAINMSLIRMILTVIYYLWAELNKHTCLFICDIKKLRLRSGNIFNLFFTIPYSLFNFCMGAEQYNWSRACIICHKKVKHFISGMLCDSQQDTAPQSQWGGYAQCL